MLDDYGVMLYLENRSRVRLLFGILHNPMEYSITRGYRSTQWDNPSCRYNNTNDSDLTEKRGYRDDDILSD